jgi:hypothetical protein
MYKSTVGSYNHFFIYHVIEYKHNIFFMNRYTLLFFLSFIIFSVYGQTPVRQWTGIFNGQGDFNDRYTCIVSDAAGNIYVAGSTVNPDRDRDVLIKKFSTQGTLVWSFEMDGTGSGPDEASAIVLDASGNIYVSATSKGLITGSDYLTLKLNSSGDTVWTRRYDYVTEYDQANSVFVDNNGTIYVTGQSDSDPGPASNDDYATISYSASGVQNWVVRYNGSGNGTDRVVKVTGDGAGNVYVTGRSSNGVDDDYVTIKYNSSGAQQWLKTVDRGGRDRATAMVSDASGLYITGRSSNGADDDFLTIKYDFAGNVIYQAVYQYQEDDRAEAITVDASGNAYVTGESDGTPGAAVNYDFQTVAYGPSGNQLWQNRYSSTFDDIPFAISVSGNVLAVAGTSATGITVPSINDAVTVSYASSGGTQNWVQVYAGAGGNDDAASAVLARGSQIITAGYAENSSAERDALCIWYTSVGSAQITDIFNGIGDNNDNVRGIAVDAQGNVFSAGYSVENKQNRNAALVKMSNTGTVICHNTINGTGTGSVDDYNGVILDPSQNPVCAGYLLTSGESNNILISSLSNSTCDTGWTKQINGPGAGSDKLYDITTDGAGFVYVTGRVDTDPSAAVNEAVYTAKLNPSGTIIWSSIYNSTGIVEDRGKQIRVGTSGNVYVSGRTWVNGYYDVLLLKYDNNGNQLWAKTFDGGSGSDDPADLAVGWSDEAYISAKSAQSFDTVYDYMTLKYDASGNLLWQNRYNGAGNGDDIPAGIAIDYGGSAVVVGESYVSAADLSDMVTIKYDGAGNQLWLKSYNGSKSIQDVGDDVAINAQDQIYITGHTNMGSSTSTKWDMITFIYDGAGNELWSDQYNGPADSSDVPNVILLNGPDEFYVAGSTADNIQMRNIAVLKYVGKITSVTQFQSSKPDVFPNPGNGNVTLQGFGEGTSFRIYTMQGQEVLTIRIQSGLTEAQLYQLSPGTYFYKGKDNSGNSVHGKLVITR